MPLRPAVPFQSGEGLALSRAVSVSLRRKGRPAQVMGEPGSATGLEQEEVVSVGQCPLRVSCTDARGHMGCGPGPCLMLALFLGPPIALHTLGHCRPKLESEAERGQPSAPGHAAGREGPAPPDPGATRPP